MSFTIKIFKKIVLQTSLTSCTFSVIAFKIFPTISETISGATNILLKTSLTCQTIYQVFVVTVKAMVNFIWRMGQCAAKCFCFWYIETYLTTVTLAFIRSCLKISYDGSFKTKDSQLFDFQRDRLIENSKRVKMNIVFKQNERKL